VTIVCKKEDHEGLPEKVSQHVTSRLLVGSDKCEALLTEQNGVSVRLAVWVGGTGWTFGGLTNAVVSK